MLQSSIRYAVPPILSALNRLCCGTVDPGLRLACVGMTITPERARNLIIPSKAGTQLFQWLATGTALAGVTNLIVAALARRL